MDNKRDKTVGGGLCLCLFGWELIFGNYLKLFIDELFGWPSTALNKQKMKENQKLINEQNTQSNSEEKWCKVICTKSISRVISVGVNVTSI